MTCPGPQAWATTKNCCPPAQIWKNHCSCIQMLAYLREMNFENNHSDHDTWSIWCHVRIHVDFYIILHSHTPLVLQVQCAANLGWLRLFHQWECLKCSGHGLCVLCVKWPSVWVQIFRQSTGQPRCDGFGENKMWEGERETRDEIKKSMLIEPT
jgi:hypothetical protein